MVLDRTRGPGIIDGAADADTEDLLLRRLYDILSVLRMYFQAVVYVGTSEHGGESGGSSRVFPGVGVPSTLRVGVNQAKVRVRGYDCRRSKMCGGRVMCGHRNDTREAYEGTRTDRSVQSYSK